MLEETENRFREKTAKARAKGEVIPKTPAPWDEANRRPGGLEAEKLEKKRAVEEGDI